MTCRDCTKKDVCKSMHKSFKYDKDGDSWANWCDDFKSIHKNKTVYKDGLEITQCGYNFHIWVTDEKTGELLLHAQCDKSISEEQLKQYADLVNNSKLDEIFNEIFNDKKSEIQ